MARPRRRSRQRTSPSLFPFLSVLACVIGTLTLIIAATATSQIASGGVDIERYERLEAEIADGRRRLSLIESLDRENTELTASLAATREEAARLEAEKARAADTSGRFAELRAALRETEARVAALEAQRATLEREGAAKRGKLAERRRQVANAPIKLRPSGTGYGLAPHFVECRKDGIVLFESPDWLGHRVPLSRIRTSPEYQRFLRRVSFREAGSVIFLIRRGGVDAYEEAFRRARRQRVRSGEMPIVGQGELDFSAVDGA